MTKENLIALALQFRTLKMWEVFDDAMIFGVRLPDGETGYCCVMGNMGQHYAISLYKGISGFSTYLNMVNPMEDVDMLEMFQTFDCMNCDFVNASESDLTSAEKKLIRAVAKEGHIKMCRSNGYPEFLRYDHGFLRNGLDEDELADMGMALKAGIEVARRIEGKSWPEIGELGFPESSSYPTREGGTRIPMLDMREDGKFEWSTVETPAVRGGGIATPVFANVMSAGRLKTMRRAGVFQCKVMHIPAMVKSEAGLFYPPMMVCIDDNGMAFPVMQKSDKIGGGEEMLEQLAFTLISMDAYPEALLVDDKYSETFLEDFCIKTGIKLRKAEYLPELEKLAGMLCSQLGR